MYENNRLQINDINGMIFLVKFGTPKSKEHKKNGVNEFGK